MVFVNFKTYEQGTGDRALELVRILSSAQDETGVAIIPVVQLVDARECGSMSRHDVWVQHVDSIEYGKHTGWILPEGVSAGGAKGTFINHSEHKLDREILQATVARCKEVNLQTMIFAKDVEELSFVVTLGANYVAYEPPELIASPTTSVAKSQPGIIGKAAEVAESAGILLIVGAGVKSSEDVRTSLRLGATGVAVSSEILLNNNPKKVVLELAEGFK